MKLKATHIDHCPYLMHLAILFFAKNLKFDGTGGAHEDKVHSIPHENKKNTHTTEKTILRPIQIP